MKLRKIILMPMTAIMISLSIPLAMTSCSNMKKQVSLFKKFYADEQKQKLSDFWYALDGVKY